MTASEQAAATGGPSVQVPIDLGAEVVVYNLSLPSGQRLHLTGPVTAPGGPSVAQTSAALRAHLAGGP